MPRDARVLLNDIVQASTYLLDESEKMDFQSYLQDLKTQFAFLHNFTMIGEVMASLRDSFPDVFAKFSEASKIVSLRNLIVHRYWVIDPEDIWSTTTTKVALLREEALEALENLNS